MIYAVAFLALKEQLDLHKNMCLAQRLQATPPHDTARCQYAQLLIATAQAAHSRDCGVFEPTYSCRLSVRDPYGF